MSVRTIYLCSSRGNETQLIITLIILQETRVLLSQKEPFLSQVSVHFLPFLLTLFSLSSPFTYKYLAHQPLFSMPPWAFDFTGRCGEIDDRPVLIEEQLTEITDHKFGQRHVLTLARYMDDEQEIMVKIRHE